MLELITHKYNKYKKSKIPPGIGMQKEKKMLINSTN